MGVAFGYIFTIAGVVRVDDSGSLGFEVALVGGDLGDFSRSRAEGGAFDFPFAVGLGFEVGEKDFWSGRSVQGDFVCGVLEKGGVAYLVEVSLDFDESLFLCVKEARVVHPADGLNEYGLGTVVRDLEAHESAGVTGIVDVERDEWRACFEANLDSVFGAVVDGGHGITALKCGVWPVCLVQGSRDAVDGDVKAHLEGGGRL